MALTGMAAKDWRQALDFSTRKVKTLIYMEEVLDQHDAQEGGPKGMEDLVSHFKELNGETNWGKWEVDQV